MTRRTYAIGAGALVIAGGLSIVYSIREQHAHALATASQLYRAFDVELELSDSEAQALNKLNAADTGVRAAFLRIGLADAKSVVKLGVREHALSIALSQVDRREARKLFDDELLPCIGKTSDSAILRQCYSLSERWSIWNALEPKERDGVADTLVDRMIVLTEQRNLDVARSLAAILAPLASQISEHKASELAARLSSKIDATFAHDRLAPLLAALTSVSPHGSSRTKVATARTLVDRMILEHKALAMPLWAAALAPLGKEIPTAQADELVSELMRRVEGEAEAGSLESVVTAMNALAVNLSSAKAEQVAGLLIARMRKGDAVTLPAETAVIKELAHKLRPETLDHARATLMDNLRSQSDEKAMALAGSNLGELSDGVAAGGFDEAIRIIVEKMSRQDGAYELTLLGGALENLAKVGISPSVATKGAKLLVERIGREHHIPELLRVSVGLEILAKSVPDENPSPLVARLIDCMQDSSSPSVLRAIAFNIGTLEDGASRAQIVSAANTLSRRIAIENRPVAVRALAAALLNLGDQVPEDFLEHASDRAKKLLETETNFEGRRDLTATVRALEKDDDDKDETERVAEQPKLDEAVAHKLLDPLCEPGEWDDLASQIAPAKDIEKIADDEDETADFHTLLVADDDGESEDVVKALSYSIDFNRLSDALDRYRPQRVSENKTTPAMMTGVALMIVSLFLAIAALRQRKSPA